MFSRCKSADAYESAIAPCRAGYQRCNQYLNNPCHRGGRAEPLGVGCNDSDTCYSAGIDIFQVTLVGSDQPEQMFALTQKLSMYDADLAQSVV